MAPVCKQRAATAGLLSDSAAGCINARRGRSAGVWKTHTDSFISRSVTAAGSVPSSKLLTLTSVQGEKVLSGTTSHATLHSARGQEVFFCPAQVQFVKQTASHCQPECSGYSTAVYRTGSVKERDAIQLNNVGDVPRS